MNIRELRFWLIEVINWTIAMRQNKNKIKPSPSLTLYGIDIVGRTPFFSFGSMSCIQGSVSELSSSISGSDLVGFHSSRGWISLPVGL